MAGCPHDVTGKHIMGKSCGEGAPDLYRVSFGKKKSDIII
jgi:hypothetical protein